MNTVSRGSQGRGHPPLGLPAEYRADRHRRSRYRVRAAYAGTSGGPVYLAPDGGPAQIVGIFNSVWGGFPAAVSWRSTSEQVHADLGVTPLA